VICINYTVIISFQISAVVVAYGGFMCETGSEGHYIVTKTRAKMRFESAFKTV